MVNIHHPQKKGLGLLSTRSEHPVDARITPAWQLPRPPGHCRLVQGPGNFNKLALLKRSEVINTFADYLIAKLCKPKETVTDCMALPRPPHPSSSLSPFTLLHC